MCSLSECTSHLGEYAANHGLSRMTRISRIGEQLSLQYHDPLGCGKVARYEL